MRKGSQAVRVSPKVHKEITSIKQKFKKNLGVNLSQAKSLDIYCHLSKGGSIDIQKKPRKKYTIKLK